MRQATATASFHPVGNHPLQIADVGHRPHTRTILLRHIALSAAERRQAQHVPGTRIVLIGGERTRRAVRAMLVDLSRRQLSELLQRPISGRTYHNLLAYLDVPR